MTEKDRWKNRRRMAWLALIAGLAFPVLLLFTESAQLGAVAGSFYAFAGAVVASYIGWATAEDMKFGPPSKAGSDDVESEKTQKGPT